MANIRPGTVLVVGVNGTMTLEYADRMKTHLLERLPGLADVVIITDVTQLAVFDPEPVKPDGMACTMCPKDPRDRDQPCPWKYCPART